MYELMITDYFSAAHQLRGYEGKCEHLHGHNWKVEICIFSNKLNELGMIIDFNELKTITGKVLAPYDHSFLNELAPFLQNNPTTENIAHHIFLQVKQLLPSTEIRVKWVRVWESESSCASYTSAGD